MSEVDAVVRRVSQQAKTWQALDREGLIAILASLQKEVHQAAEEWSRLSSEAKQIPAGASYEGEEWLTGPTLVLRYLRLLRDQLLRNGFPQENLSTQKVFTENGESETEEQWVAKVFPFESWDPFLFPGVSAEVWGEPGSLPTTAGLRQANPPQAAAVFGAGNISSIPPLDFLDQLFRHGRVVIVKLNPINEVLRPCLEKAFRILISAGFLGFVSGDHDIGAELARQPLVKAIHVTGSEAGFHAIRGSGGQEKEYSAELGAVTPVIITPGPWTKKDLRRQAKHLAGMLALNNGYNCLTPKLIITSKHWRQREAFLNELEQALRSLTPRVAWYPGAHERWFRFAHQYGAQLPPRSAEELPFVLLRDVPLSGEELAMREEAFCGVLTETAIPAADTEEFLELAVSFANEHVYGSLSANLVAAPTAPREAVERAIARLRYGTVGLNVWAGLGFALASTTWGGFPGSTVENPGSGLDVVHNAFLFDHPQRSVLRAPFRPSRRPVWWPNFRRLPALGRGMVEYEAAPSLGRLLRLLPSAYLG